MHSILHYTTYYCCYCRLQSTEQLLLLFLRKRSCINFQDRGKSNQPEWTKEPLQEQQKQQWHQQDIATNLKKMKKKTGCSNCCWLQAYIHSLTGARSTRAPLNNTNTYHANWAGYSEEQQWAIKSKTSRYICKDILCYEPIRCKTYISHSSDPISVVFPPV